MLTNEAAFQELSKYVNEFEKGRSPHWQYEQNQFEFDDSSFAGVGPMGTFSGSKGIFPTIAHFIFQIPFRLFGFQYKHFLATDRLARKIARRQGRQYDLDFLRHTLTLAMLRQYVDLENNIDPICIIGDGYGNMASLFLGSFLHSKVILINLTKSLIVDIICLRNGIPGLGYALVTSSAELEKALSSNEIRVILIMANDAEVIEKQSIAVAVNIESMMEMDRDEIDKYFDLLRSGPGEATFFYCCNQEHKRFSGVGVSNFFDYPWSILDQTVFHGICPWTTFRYGNTPPFFSRRTPDLHRLVKLKNINN